MDIHLHAMSSPVTVTRRKSSHVSSWGLSFLFDNAVHRLVLTDMTSDSPFEGTDLQPGMHILSINGYDTSDAFIGAKMETLLARMHGEVTIVAEPPKPVFLTRYKASPATPVGLSCGLMWLEVSSPATTPSVVVTAVAPDSPFAADKIVTPGARLLSINNIYISKDSEHGIHNVMAPSQVERLLQRALHKITLQIVPALPVTKRDVALEQSQIPTIDKVPCLHKQHILQDSTQNTSDSSSCCSSEESSSLDDEEQTTSTTRGEETQEDHDEHAGSEAANEGTDEPEDDIQMTTHQPNESTVIVPERMPIAPITESKPTQSTSHSMTSSSGDIPMGIVAETDTKVLVEEDEIIPNEEMRMETINAKIEHNVFLKQIFPDSPDEDMGTTNRASHVAGKDLAMIARHAMHGQKWQAALLAIMQLAREPIKSRLAMECFCKMERYTLVARTVEHTAWIPSLECLLAPNYGPQQLTMALQMHNDALESALDTDALNTAAYMLSHAMEAAALVPLPVDTILDFSLRCILIRFFAVMQEFHDFVALVGRYRLDEVALRLIHIPLDPQESPSDSPWTSLAMRDLVCDLQTAKHIAKSAKLPYYHDLEQTWQGQIYIQTVANKLFQQFFEVPKSPATKTLICS